MASERSARRSWFGRGRTRALLSVGLLLGMGAVATSAYWTEQTQVTGVTLNSGAMHIDLPGSNRVKAENYSWTAFDLALILPGTSRAQTIQVSNRSLGPISFNYRVQASATPSTPGTLGAVLQLKVTDGTVSGTTCTGTAIGTGTGSLSGFNEPVGTAIGPGGSATLCFEVSRPATPVTVTGSPATITFTFPATQVSG